MKAWRGAQIDKKPVHSDYDATVALIQEGRLRPLSEREGQCFRFAYEACLSGFGNFVIGTARGKDAPRIFHATAQALRSKMVYYDGVLDACFEEALYLKLFGWLPVLSMSAEQAREFGIKTGKCPTPLTLGFPSILAVENEIRSILRSRA